MLYAWRGIALPIIGMWCVQYLKNRIELTDGTVKDITRKTHKESVIKTLIFPSVVSGCFFTRTCWNVRLPVTVLV